VADLLCCICWSSTVWKLYAMIQRFWNWIITRISRIYSSLNFSMNLLSFLSIVPMYLNFETCSNWFITYLYNTRSRVIEKLIVAQLVKKFSVFYETRRFITVFLRTCHWSLCWARWIQSTSLHPNSLWSISVLSTTYA